jgi:hypothetical protein
MKHRCLVVELGGGISIINGSVEFEVSKCITHVIKLYLVFVSY